MEPNENQFTSETNLNGVRSSQVSLEAPRRKVNKGLVILVILLIIAALGGLTVLIMGPSKVMNQIHKTFTSKENYYKWLEEKNAEGVLDVLCDDNKEGFNVAADVSLTPGSTFASLLSMKDPLKLHFDVNQKDQQMLSQLQMKYKDSDLGGLSVFWNQKESKLFVQRENLSKQYISMKSLSQGLDLKVLQSSKLPKLLSEYVGKLIDNTGVTLQYEKEDELTIGSSSVKGNRIIAAYPLGKTLRELSDLCIKVKSDEKLQEACENAGITKSVYRQTLENLSDKLKESCDSIKTTDTIVFTCYVDETGAISGRTVELTLGQDSYQIQYILTDDKIALSVSYNDMEYLIAECDYSKKDKSEEFEAVSEEQTITLKDYREKNGTDFTSDFVKDLSNKLGLSKAADLIFSVLEIEDKDAGKFEFTLGDYLGLKVHIDETEVTDEDIDQAVIEFVKYNSDMLPITDRKEVEEGDCVNIDFTGKVDGKDFKNNTASDYEIKAGDNEFLDGFDAQLIGKKVGETVEVKAKLPDTYSDSALAGKEAVFTVKINAIGIREFTDEFVAYNTEYSTTDEYRNYLKDGLLEQKKYNDQSAIDNAILEKIVANSTFKSVNQSEIDAKEKEMQDTYKTYADYYGVDMETFARETFNLSLEDFNDQVSQYAEEYVKETYVLAEIAKAEKMELSDDEYKQMATDSLEQYQYDSIEELEEKNGGHEKVKQSLLEEKVMDFLRDHTMVSK